MRPTSTSLSTRLRSVNREKRQWLMIPACVPCIAEDVTQVPNALSKIQTGHWRHILSFTSFPTKHSVPQYLNTKKILQTSFFHMSQWEEEILLSPVLQAENLGTETLRSKTSINFAPNQRYLGPEFLSIKHHMVFNTFKVQLPITTAASTQHLCKSDPMVLSQALREQKAHR